MKRAVVVACILLLVLIPAVAVLAASPKDFGRKLHVDSRWVEKVLASPQCLSEQSEDWLADWEGPAAFIAWSKEKSNVRRGYFANKEGYKTLESIQKVTKLTLKETRDAITKLEKKGKLCTPIEKAGVK